MDENIEKINKYKEILCKNIVADEIISHLITVDTVQGKGKLARLSYIEM